MKFLHAESLIIPILRIFFVKIHIFVDRAPVYMYIAIKITTKHKGEIMKKLPITEANRNFSHITEELEEDGSLILTKHGKDAYVLMTKEEFSKREFLADAGLSAVYEEPEGINPALSLAANGVMDLELQLIEKSGERIAITELWIQDGEESFIEKTTCKRSNISFREEDMAILEIPLGPGVTISGVDTLYLDPEDRYMPDIERRLTEEAIKGVAALMTAYKDTPVQELTQPFRITTGRR